MKGQTASLCVRRATYWCPELKAEDPAKKVSQSVSYSGHVARFVNRTSPPRPRTTNTNTTGHLLQLPLRRQAR